MFHGDIDIMIFILYKPTQKTLCIVIFLSRPHTHIIW